jgi:hypothetical protein
MIVILIGAAAFHSFFRASNRVDWTIGFTRNIMSVANAKSHTSSSQIAVSMLTLEQVISNRQAIELRKTSHDNCADMTISSSVGHMTAPGQGILSSWASATCDISSLTRKFAKRCLVLLDTLSVD